MNFAVLRKKYSNVPWSAKNIKWRKLTDAEFNTAMQQRQVVANCYDEATRYSLLASKKGREYLRSRIRIQKGSSLCPAYKIKLNINGKDESFRATKADYFGTFVNAMYNYFTPRLSLGVNIAVSKMISKYPSMKAWYLKLYSLSCMRNRNYEFNKPSNAFKWFTGKKPLAIGESGCSLTLKKHRKEVIGLLNELGESSPDNYSFVLLNSFKKLGKNSRKWHTMPIVDVDSKKQTVSFMDKRTNEIFKVTFEDVINNCKAIVGVKHS